MRGPAPAVPKKDMKINFRRKQIKKGSKAPRQESTDLIPSGVPITTPASHKNPAVHSKKFSIANSNSLVTEPGKLETGEFGPKHNQPLEERDMMYMDNQANQEIDLQAAQINLESPGREQPQIMPPVRSSLNSLSKVKRLESESSG